MPASNTDLKHDPTAQNSSKNPKKLGFWSCWSLTVGIMIGSGIFLLPSVLAPYGKISFIGWGVTALGAILFSLVIARLSARTHASGGVYRYARDAFGDLTGFLIAWGYWACYWIALPAMAIAFIGYLSVFFPAIKASPNLQLFIALSLIWIGVIVNMKGMKEAAFVQILMTLLKIIPLLLVIALGVSVGDYGNIEKLESQTTSPLAAVAATALLTMWAFSGLEAGAMPAGDVRNAEKTIPRAVIFGTLTVAFIYIASTAAVMFLLDPADLTTSTAPFADAVAQFGEWAPALIAIGALFSTAGALNGTLFVTGQVPMAMAIDGLAPQRFAKRNQNGSPRFSLFIAGVLASVLLIINFSRGLIGIFTFMITMSTLAFLVPLFVCSLAELKYSWKAKTGSRLTNLWIPVSILAALYSVFTILGSGVEVIVWGIVFFVIGLPIYFLLARSQRHPHV